MVVLTVARSPAVDAILKTALRNGRRIWIGLATDIDRECAASWYARQASCFEGWARGATGQPTVTGYANADPVCWTVTAAVSCGFALVSETAGGAPFAIEQLTRGSIHLFPGDSIAIPRGAFVLDRLP